jgi:hypothetical protein
MRIRMCSAFGLALLFSTLMLVPPKALSDVASLPPVADASLIGIAPENNNGGEAWVLAGVTQNYTQNRGLFRFDLSSDLPQKALIQSVNLVLEVTKQPPPGDYNAAVFELHRVLQPWGEGDKYAVDNSGGQGALAGLGEVTWLNRFAFTDQTWANPGGAPGLDYVAAPSSQAYINGVGESPYTFASTPALVADVQGWVDNPLVNHGWMLICSDEVNNFTALRFGSREDPMATPILHIEFTVIPEPSAALLLAIGVVLWTAAHRRTPRPSSARKSVC